MKRLARITGFLAVLTVLGASLARAQDDPADTTQKIVVRLLAGEDVAKVASAASAPPVARELVRLVVRQDPRLVEVVVPLLERVSGETHGRDFSAWRDWLKGKHDLEVEADDAVTSIDASVGYASGAWRVNGHELADENALRAALVDLRRAAGALRVPFRWHVLVDPPLGERQAGLLKTTLESIGAATDGPPLEQGEPVTHELLPVCREVLAAVRQRRAEAARAARAEAFAKEHTIVVHGILLDPAQKPLALIELDNCGHSRVYEPDDFLRDKNDRNTEVRVVKIAEGTVQFDFDGIKFLRELAAPR
jgi:hypothetical protein